MQSVLQYGTFRKQSEEQCGRHTADQENPTRHDDTGGGRDIPDLHEEEEKEQEESGLEGSEHPSRNSPAINHTLSRTNTRTTTRSMGTRLGVTLTGVNVRDRRTNEGGGPGARRAFVVDFDGARDPLNPHNWSRMKRIRATMLIASIGFVVGVASSIDSPATSRAAREFGVSEVVDVLATGLYLIGFGVGALFAGPFSETLGRNS